MKKIFLLIVFFAVCCVFVACSANYTVTFVQDGVAPQTVKSGQKATAPDVDRDGYQVSWYTDPSLENLYDFDAPVTRNLTLYPKWEQVVFTVTFAGEGITPTSVKVNKGDKVAPPSVSRDGYWAVWTSGGFEWDFDAPVTSDLTLTLSWTEARYTVRFYDSADRLVATRTVGAGSSIDVGNLSAPHLYPDFYTFTGWSESLVQVTQDMDVYALYSYNSLPDSLFDFVAQPDHTYGIRFKSDVSFDGIELSGCMGLPSAYNGRAVTVVLPQALSGFTDKLSGLQKLLIPDSYRVISNQVAQYLYVPEVVVAEGVQEVWGYAFQYYRGDSIRLPSSLTYIEPFAFSDCGGEVLLADGDNYKSEDGDVYTADGKTLVYVNGADHVETYTVKEHVNAIYPMLFAGNMLLQSVTFEGDVEEIPTGLFAQCEALSSVTFQGKVKSIAGYGEKNYTLRCGLECPHYEPFEGCGSLKNFQLPDGLEYVGDFALEDVPISAVSFGKELSHVGLGSFNAAKLQSVTVDAANTHFRDIDGCALAEKRPDGDRMVFFAGQSDRQTLTAEDLVGVTEFDARCFDAPAHLVSLEIPNGVTALPQLFVYGAKKLQRISLPHSLISVSDSSVVQWSDSYVVGSATVGSDALTTIDWRDGCAVTSLPVGSFVGIFDSFEVPASVTELEVGFVNTVSPYGNLRYTVASGNGAFKAVDGDLYRDDGETLTLVAGARNKDRTDYAPTVEQLGKPLEAIASGAFADNVFLQRVVLPEGVKTIGEMAFYNCLSLADVTLPSTLTKIGVVAFFGLGGVTDAMAEQYPELQGLRSDGLHSVTFLGKLPQMGYDDLYGYAVFDTICYDDSYHRVIAPNPAAKFTVPAEFFEEYYDFFYSYGGTDYCNKLDVSNVVTYTYKFRTNGGSDVEDIVGVYKLIDMPNTLWQGQGTRYFQGWFTADGTEGDWGNEVNFFRPYRGTPDVENIVTLYAKWGDIRREDGSKRQFAFDLGYEQRQHKLAFGTSVEYWFTFTADKDGVFDLVMDFGGNVEYAYGMYRYDSYTDTLEALSFDSAAEGFRCEKGETYYILLSVGDVIYSEDWSVETGSVDAATPYGFALEYKEEQEVLPPWF